jgi:Ca-activated chloride channel family protein
MNSFRFQDPWWFLLLIPLVAAGVSMFYRRPKSAALYSNVAMLRGLPVTLAQRIKRLLPILFLTGATLLIVALARPQQGREESREWADGIAIEMIVDRSRSMDAMDFNLKNEPANRLQVIKKSFRDFILGDGRELQGRPTDQVGLIAFGGFAEAKCPLTLDHAALEKVLDDVQTPRPLFNPKGEVINARLMNEESSTAIGDALSLGVERLKDVKAKSKVMILLTDGDNNAGALSPMEGAKIAKSFGIKVYTIGIGTNEPVPFPVYLFDRTEMVMQVMPFDEKALQDIADATGGKYYYARNAEALKKVCADIDKMEKTVSEGRRYMHYRELYAYFLFPAIGFLMMESLLVSTRFRTLP